MELDLEIMKTLLLTHRAAAAPKRAAMHQPAGPHYSLELPGHQHQHQLQHPNQHSAALAAALAAPALPAQLPAHPVPTKLASPCTVQHQQAALLPQLLSGYALA